MINKIDENVLLFTSKFVKQKEYWINKLSRDMAKTEILSGGEKKYNNQAAREKIDLSFPLYLSHRLIQISKNSDLSIYIILLAGLKSLIYRYTQNPDITVISPINKLKISDETMNDLLVLIRDRIENDMTFKDLILCIRQSVLEAYGNQDYPFENVFEYLFDQPLEQNNGFISSIVCSLKNIHDEANIEGLRGKLSILFLKEGDQIKGNITYDASSYEKNYIEQISRHFINLLENPLEDINIKCTEISFLSEQEKKQLIYDFNNNKADFPRDKTIYRLIEEYANITPDNIAVSFEGKGITYRQLNEKSNQIDRILRNKGVKNDQPVGILLERSPLMVESILAVWKAGGAYIPIDSLYPFSRIYGILKDSGSIVLITQSKHVKRHYQLEEFYKEKIIKLDEQESEISKNSTVNLNLPVDRNNLAYIIYTSGSTGKPKGAMVEHIGMMNHIQAKINDLQVTRESIVAQNASHTFDISVWQFFIALTQGGKTVIYPDRIILDPGQFLSRLIEDRVTILELVPSYLSVILDSLDLNPKKIESLKYLLVTGEAVKSNLVERWFEKYPAVKMVNAYGPTEASDDITHYIMDKAPGMESIPIGKPLQNFNIYIVDEHMKLCPQGAKGEICVSGVGVGRGYLNDEKRTKQVFKEDPFVEKTPGEKKGVRLYKTGDIGRWLPDGTIEFFGRKDYQVKIRGFRIELGEIESHLVNHLAVKEAVVIDKEDEQKNKYLCAYLVKNGEAEVLEIKEYLQRHLPDYMVPIYFMELEKLPLTPNGKIDRKALPDFEIDNGVEGIAPRNAIEEILVEIMASVLGRANIGINENFFEVGGDSIKAIQIASRMYKVGYKIEMRDIFQNPIISELAPNVTKLERIASQSVISGKLPLTPIQEEFFQKIKIDRHHNNQAVMLFSKEGFEEEATRKVFTKIQEHHDALRINYKEDNKEIVQTNHGLEYPLSLQVYDSRELQVNENKEDVHIALKNKVDEIQESIDLEKGPLMKLGLFHLDDGGRLLIVIHHLVIDTVSWRILFEDIESLYQQHKNGEPFVLPMKTDSFKVWSEKLYEYANNESFLEEKTYWAELEAAEVREIKKDFEEETNCVKDAGIVSFELNETETKQLLTRVNEAFGTDINDILLAALALAIGKSYGHHKLLIALEGHGREEILKDVNISRTVGWFTSIFPVLLDFSYTDDLSRLIIGIKEELRRVPNNGIGYGILKYLTKEEHKKGMDFKMTPQISFNYLGQFDADVKQMSFEMAKESAGNSQSMNGQREFELEVLGMIAQGRLVMSITYSKKQYKPENMERLFNYYKEELTGIISFCSNREKPELTPSDLTYTKLSIEMLEQLKQQYLIQDIYVLSPMQEGMLFHSLYEQNTPTYFEQISYRLQGQLDEVYVKKSLNELVKRYDILRTAFIYEGLEQPLQVVLKDREVDFLYQDIRGIAGDNASDAKEAYIKGFKEKDKQTPFDLAKDALVRISILRLGEETFEFIWSFYHIIMDGWCVGILNAEYFEIYSSYLENRPFQLPQVKPYRTFIQWLEKQDKNESKKYWSKYLEHYNEMASVPKTRKVLETSGDHKRQLISIWLDREKTGKLNRLAIRNQVTMNTLIQAVWGILLSKYCCKEDVVFGAVVSGRPAELEGVESMVGLFINTIPVRIRYEKKTKFNALLKKVQEEAVNGEPHHYYPLSHIQYNSELKNNLLDHILIFENYPVAEQIDGLVKREKEDQSAAALTISNIEVFEQTNYDFNIGIYHRDQIQFNFQYNANVYDREIIEGVAGHLVKIIDQILYNEELYIEKLTLLTDDEETKLKKRMGAAKGKLPIRDKINKRRYQPRTQTNEIRFNF